MPNAGGALPASPGPLPAELAHPSELRPTGRPSSWRWCGAHHLQRRCMALFAIKDVNVCFKEKCFPFKEVKTDKVIVLVTGRSPKSPLTMTWLNTNAHCNRWTALTRQGR